MNPYTSYLLLHAEELDKRNGLIQERNFEGLESEVSEVIKKWAPLVVDPIGVQFVLCLSRCWNPSHVKSILMEHMARLDKHIAAAPKMTL